MIKTLYKILYILTVTEKWVSDYGKYELASQHCENTASSHITEWFSPQNYILPIATMMTIICDFSKHSKLYFKAVIYNPKLTEKLEFFKIHVPKWDTNLTGKHY